MVAPALSEPSAVTLRGMKTIVSLPGGVFDRAEREARRTRKSRSQLYADALVEYLARHAPEEATEAMNLVVDRLEQSMDTFAASAASRRLQQSEW